MESVLSIFALLCIFSELSCFFIGVSGDTSCPRGWIANDGSCYLFAHYPQPFSEAKSYCEQHNGSLVEVYSSDVNDFIKKHLRELNTRYWWLGTTDVVTEGEWVWETSRVLTNYTDWNPGQPSGGTTENCAYFAYNVDFRWADAPCSNTNIAPICEKSGNTCVSEIQVIG